MDDTALTAIQTRLARLERHNRLLIGLVGAAAALLLMGASTAPAAPPSGSVITVDEIRAHQFTLLDPSGDEADTWGARHASGRRGSFWTFYTP